MKLFYFNPNGYGSQAFVIAETLKKAKKSLIQKLEDEGNASDAKEFLDLSRGRTIDIHEPGDVILSEIS